MGKQFRRILIGLAVILVSLTGLLAVSALVPEVGCTKSEDTQMTATRINFTVPSEVAAGQSFTINGTLERTTSPGIHLLPNGSGERFAEPFPQQNVYIYALSPIDTIVTDEHGQFSCQTVIKTPGIYIIRASYPGDQMNYFWPTDNQKIITVTGEAILNEPSKFSWSPLLIVVSLAIIISGTGYLLFNIFSRRIKNRSKKRQLPGWINYVLLVLIIGAIIYSLPGAVRRSVKLPNYVYNTSSSYVDNSTDNTTTIVDTINQTSRFLTKTRLSVPAKVDLNTSFNYQGTLSRIESNKESPLPQQEIEIMLRFAEGSDRLSDAILKINSIITDDNGRFAGKLILDKPGRYEISAVFKNTGDLYSESSDSMNVTVGKVISSPFSSWKSPGWLSIIIGLPFLLFALGIGIMVFRHRRKASGKDKEAEVNEKVVVIPSKLPSPPPTPITTHTPAPPINIGFPQISSTLPDVWGKDESLIMVFTVEGIKQVLEQYSLDIEFGSDSTIRSPINQEGRASQEHTFRKTGQYQIQAVLVKDVRNGYIPASRIVKIVDYREEIVRLYNEMIASAKGQGLSLSTKLTAREVENRLRKAFPELSSETTESLVSVFEEANYSLHTMTRPDYERMYRAVQEVNKVVLAK